MPFFKKKIVKIGLPVLGVLGIAAVYLLRPINTDDTLVKVDEVLAKGKRDFLAQPDSNTNHAKPNVIILLADDLGKYDISLYGGKAAPTPTIDSLAASGVTFTDGYVSAPICSPSRAGLLTGRYQQRFGHELQPGDRYPKITWNTWR
jgi:hypothetical protein